MKPHGRVTILFAVGLSQQFVPAPTSKELKAAAADPYALKKLNAPAVGSNVGHLQYARMVTVSSHGCIRPHQPVWLQFRGIRLVVSNMTKSSDAIERAIQPFCDCTVRHHCVCVTTAIKCACGLCLCCACAYAYHHWHVLTI